MSTRDQNSFAVWKAGSRFFPTFIEQKFLFLRNLNFWNLAKNICNLTQALIFFEPQMRELFRHSFLIWMCVQAQNHILFGVRNNQIITDFISKTCDLAKQIFEFDSSFKFYARILWKLHVCFTFMCHYLNSIFFLYHNLLDFLFLNFWNFNLRILGLTLGANALFWWHYYL